MWSVVSAATTEDPPDIHQQHLDWLKWVFLVLLKYYVDLTKDLVSGNLALPLP